MMFDNNRTQRETPAARWTLLCYVGVIGLFLGHPAAATASPTSAGGNIGGVPGQTAVQTPAQGQQPQATQMQPRTPNIHHIPTWSNQGVLSSYGHWTDSRDYGYVWAPTVYSDWTPKDKGYWTTDHHGGHVWNDKTPWTSATSRYGTWMQDGDVWVWAPWVGRYPVVLTDSDYGTTVTTPTQQPQTQSAHKATKAPSHAIYDGPKVDVFSEDSAGGSGSSNANSDHAMMMEIPDSDTKH